MLPPDKDHAKKKKVLRNAADAEEPEAAAAEPSLPDEIAPEEPEGAPGEPSIPDETPPEEPGAVPEEPSIPDETPPEEPEAAPAEPSITDEAPPEEPAPWRLSIRDEGPPDEPEERNAVPEEQSLTDESAPREPYVPLWNLPRPDEAPPEEPWKQRIRNDGLTHEPEDRNAVPEEQSLTDESPPKEPYVPLWNVPPSDEAPSEGPWKQQIGDEGLRPAEREERDAARAADRFGAGGASGAVHESEQRVPREDVPWRSEAVTAVAPPLPARRSGGGFWTALLGTLLGAVIGAGAVWYVLQRMPRAPDPAVTATLGEQAGALSGQGDRLAAVEGELAALKEAMAANDVSGTIDALRAESEQGLGALGETVAGIGGRVDTLEGRLGEFDGRLGQLDAQMGDVGSRLDAGDARIADLEARPIADPDTANQALRSEVADMRREVEQATEEARAQVDTMRNELAAAAEATQAKVEAAETRAAELDAEAQARAAAAEAEAQARAAAAEAEAQAAARAAEAKVALAEVQAALDSGTPYAEALAALGADVPEALAARAESGVPTLGELLESYPDAARAALGASRLATPDGAPGGRVLAFLRNQTQARSLTPQTGETPDAILSRAEAALEGGDVRAALAELGTLSADGRAAMQGWIDGAESRAEAVAAADALSQGMN